MSRQDIRFSGINRNSNISDSKIGDCEELINICSENGALRIVKDKQEISVNIPYNEVIIHDISGERNYIGKGPNGLVWFEPETGNELKRLYDTTDDVYLATLNSMLIISDRSAVKEIVYNYNNGTYTLLYDGLEFDIDINVKHYSYPNQEKHSVKLLASSITQYLEACQAEVNKFKQENKNYCEGIFQCAFTITLYNDNEIGMYGLKAITTPYKDHPGNKNAFISTEDNSSYYEITIDTIFNFDLFFYKYIIEYAENPDLFKRYKELIKKINLYVSVPITRMPITERYVTLGADFKDDKAQTNSNGFVFTPRYPKDSGAEKTLMYKQKSWSFEEFCNGGNYTLEFGGDIQTTGATMEVYPSTIERAGKMLSYNNRVHFYDSVVRFNSSSLHPSKLTLLDDYPDYTIWSSIDAVVFIYIRVNNGENVLKYDNMRVGLYKRVADSAPIAILSEMITYPDSRAYKMDIITLNATSANNSDFANKKISIELYSSPAYNYSYFYGGRTYTVVSTDFDGVYPDISDIYIEHNAINVTAAGTPMVFPVEHSYLFDGTIKNLAYATEPISQTQIGQYPLYVFTDKGIFAMEQGSGTVLYANRIAINTDKCDGDVAQTRNGVIYIANGGIYVLSGRNTLNISLPISGPLDIDIRKSGAYAQCCLNDKLYNIAENLSQTELQDYIQDAKLVYIPYRDTLVVSNSNYKYSYVFSFIYKTWYKITETIGSVGHNVILQSTPLSGDEARNILVDYAKDKESSKVVHLQSRPMSFAQAYTIIRRLILHCKASITLPDNLSLYLFASNNLSDWHCVSASQKSDVTLDHIRLQRVARAYKYYIIIIGGQINTDTELSYIMMEIEERFESKIR